MTAAAWAPLSLIALAPDADLDGGRAVRLARADFLSAADDAARLEQMLAAVLRPVLDRLASAQHAGVIPLWLGCPPHRPGLPVDLGARLEAVARKSARALALRVEICAADGAEALQAIARLAAEWDSERDALALVAAVDTLVSDDAMDDIFLAGRLHREDHSWGLVPGEGAACILLGSVALARALRVKPLCRVVGWGMASATDDDAPGVALGQAVQGATASRAAGEPISLVFGDLNGERGRSDAWAFSSLRLGPRLAPTAHEVSPALTWGDAGAASGALLATLAATVAAAGWLSAPALLWSASHRGRCAALLLEAAPAGPLPAPPARDDVPDHVDHDRRILDSLLHEAAALAEQRVLVAQAQAVAPLPDWKRAAAVEGRLDRVLRALRLGGELLVPVAEAALASDEAPVVHAAARALLAHGRTAQAVALFASAGRLDPMLSEAFAQALLHGLDDPARAAVLPQLLSDERLLPVALSLAWRAGLPAPLTTVGRAARLSPAQLGVALPNFVSRLGSPADLPFLQPWLFGDDETWKTAAMVAMLRHSGPVCEMFLRDQAHLTWSLAPMALLGTAGCADLLLRPPSAHAQHPDYPLALGLLGDPRAIPTLIDLLSEAVVSRPAAIALVLLTGAELTETATEVEIDADEDLFADQLAARRAGDQEVGVTRRTVNRVCQDPAVWRTYWTDHQHQFDRRHRYRMGQRHSAAADLQALAHPWFPPRWRACLADALALRHGVALAFDTELPVAQQEAALARRQRHLSRTDIAQRRPA